MEFLAQLEAAADIQTATELLLRRWENNRRFFQDKLPDLGRLFDSPAKNYELHYDSSGWNLRHKQSGALLYPAAQGGRSALFDAARALAFDPPRNPHWKLVSAQEGLRNEDEAAFEFSAAGINRLNQLLQADADFKAGAVHFEGADQLPVCICYGLLSGAHLACLESGELLRNGLLIYEPEPDFFLLSAYFVDYERLMAPDRGTLLVVGGHLEPLWLRRFFSERLITRGFVRLELPLYDHPAFEDAKARVEEASREVLRGWGTVEDELYGLQNKLNNHGRPQPLLCGSLEGDFPIAVVGNGPSLDNLLPFLKANREGLIIFSAGTALKPLRAAGITPDFQIEIERRDHVAGVLKAAPLGDIALIAADLIHPTTLQAASEHYLFIRDSTASERLWEPKKTVRFSNPLVGNAALALALELSRHVYLCGLDVGFRKDQKQHASRSHYDTLKDSGGEQFPARGNFSRNVWTNSLFSLSRSVLEKAIAAHPEAGVFNLSDGAFIQGAKPLHTKELMLPPIDRAAAANRIKGVFVREGCFNARDFNPAEELCRVKNTLIAVLRSAQVSDKKRLFAVMDTAYQTSAALRHAHPVSGTLLSGTYWHLLNTLFKGLLQIHRADVSDRYQAAVDTIEETLGRITL